MELDGNGLLELNPIFIDFDAWNFSYEDNSPCIDTGNPSQMDPDGSIRDIGANWFSINNFELGGLAFEALNNAGHLKKQLLVIVNDNDMSISPNIGA